MRRASARACHPLPERGQPSGLRQQVGARGTQARGMGCKMLTSADMRRSFVQPRQMRFRRVATGCGRQRKAL